MPAGSAWVCRAVAVAAALSVVPCVAAARDRPIRSIRELRRQDTVIQQWDLSCGAAALSTLFTFDHHDPVPESLIVATILRRADPVKVRARGGFSLLDLKRFAQGRGYAADGYARLSLDQLRRLGPAIVPTVLGGYDHFVVFRGVREGRILLADPAYGNRTLTIEQFEATWRKRIAFILRRPGAPRPAGSVTPPPELVVPRAAVRGALARSR